jgi:hypothetical protein
MRDIFLTTSLGKVTLKKTQGSPDRYTLRVAYRDPETYRHVNRLTQIYLAEQYPWAKKQAYLHYEVMLTRTITAIQEEIL